MNEINSKSRADMKTGTLYSAHGENGWIYYGQVTPERKVGFFRFRNKSINGTEGLLASPIMSIITVAIPSITRALRLGQWTKLGREELVETLSDPSPAVNWPVGTLDVTVCLAETSDYQTRVDDPAIQEMELMAVWDAVHHIPERLTADFGVEPAKWHVGGPIYRQRKVKEQMAIRHPDKPWHKLPDDWVPTAFN